MNGQVDSAIVAGNQGDETIADAVSEINEVFSLPVNTLRLLFKSLVS